MADIDKFCTTCVFQDTPPETTVCKTCTRGGVPDAPHWKGWHYAEESQEMPDPGDYSFVKTTLVYGPRPFKKTTSDGSTASYYVLPDGAKELQDLISYRDMNSQIGEVFRACYRYGIASHSDRLRDAKKIKFYAEAEIARLEKYGG